MNQKPRRTVPVRHYFLLLVIGVLFPVVVFSTFAVWQLANENRAVVERRLLRSATDLSVAVDRELTGTLRALTALARSEALENGDLHTFREEVDRTVKVNPSWASAIVFSPDGQMLMDTALPEGSQLPRVVETESFDRVIKTQGPAVGRMLRAGPDNALAIPLRVPVLKSEKVKYVLTMIVRSESMSDLLSRSSRAGDEWIRVVVDAAGTVVAQTRGAEQFVGQTAPPSFLAGIRDRFEGVFLDASLDDEPAYVIFSKSNLGGWATGIIVPRAVLDAPARVSFMQLAIGGIGATLLSALGAVLLSRRVETGIRSGVTAAEVLAHGQMPHPEPSGVTEVAQLHEALTRAAELLALREDERNQSLERARTARAEAEAASASKDHFLAVLSHELRTPLTPVVSAVHLMESDPALTREQRELLAMVRRNVMLEVKLIDDMLDLTRVERGKLVLDMATINLHTKLHHVLEICAPDILAKHQHIKMELGADDARLRGDGARIQQVLWNLLKNAVKFTPAEGTIYIRTRRSSDDSMVELEMQDTGIGIEASAIGRIFEAFEQAAPHVTRQFGGLGLGLAISQTIVRMHGGTLTVQSQGLSTGSTFTLRLPAPRLEELKTLELANHAAPASNKGSGRLLLVEDHRDTARMMCRLLKGYGYEVHPAHDIAEALRLAEEQQFDLVVSDLGLPDGSGYELMQQLKARHQIPGIALSGYGMEEDVRKSLAAGFSEHLTKPVDFHRLETTLHRLTSQTSASNTDKSET